MKSTVFTVCENEYMNIPDYRSFAASGNTGTSINKFIKNKISVESGFFEHPVYIGKLNQVCKYFDKLETAATISTNKKKPAQFLSFTIIETLGLLLLICKLHMV